MNDVTVLYYSASSQRPEFESKIRADLIKKIGGLPLISVTQEPLSDFGENICVGKHLNCYHNEFRQILIGLEKVKTTYIIVAEADCLYPPEYFSFKPLEPDHCYRHGNVWVLKDSKYLFKGKSHCAQLVDTKMWLNKITKSFEGMPEWSEDGKKIDNIFQPAEEKGCVWITDNPIITIKTFGGVSRYTQIKENIPPAEMLPYWGSAELLTKEMSA